MKQRKKEELDVDYIGGQAPLTKEEEMAVSDFIAANKNKNEKMQVVPAKISRLKSTLLMN